MSLAFVVDMNLSPDWVAVLTAAGFPSTHWSSEGPVTTPDVTIMAWASANGRAVLTHDLDFGTILAATNANSPSVVLLRGDDVLPETLGTIVVGTVTRHRPALEAGALLVIDIRRSRLRLLPLRGSHTP